MPLNRLRAALHLHSVLPALGVLAARDPTFADILAGRDTAVTLSTPGLAPTRVERRAGRLRISHAGETGGLRLFFPTGGQLVRAFSHQPAVVLPLAGWNHLGAARRLLDAAGARLEAVLTDRAAAFRDPDFGRLHAVASLTVAAAGAAVWLRHHPDGPALHRKLENRLLTFTTVDPEFSVWLDLRPEVPTWGVGAPPRAADAAVRFADLPTVLAELAHELDSLASLGIGTLRITGHLPLAEQLGLVMQDVDRILQPALRSLQ